MTINIDKQTWDTIDSNQEESATQIGKQYMLKICESLNKDNREFQPQETINIFKQWLDDPKCINNIIHSEITNYIYNLLNNNDKDKIESNAELLANYALKYNDENITKLSTKLYNHISLASLQTDAFNKIAQDTKANVDSYVKETENRIKETEERFVKHIKRSERDYITILGIFASIVLGSYGGFNYVSAILDKVPQEKLICGAIIGGIVVIMIVLILTSFIIKINKEK